LGPTKKLKRPKETEGAKKGAGAGGKKSELHRKTKRGTSRLITHIEGDSWTTICVAAGPGHRPKMEKNSRVRSKQGKGKDVAK